MEDEEVAVGIREPSEDRRFGVDDLHQIGHHAPGVEVAPPPDHELVLDALGDEGMGGMRPLRPALERAVGELVVVLRLERAVLEGKRVPGAPSRRQLQPHRARLAFASDDERRRGARIQERVRGVHVVRPHRQLEAVQAVRDAYRPRRTRGSGVFGRGRRQTYCPRSSTSAVPLLTHEYSLRM